MILKASQRGAAKQLAVHLLRRQDNEQIDLHEVRGFVADDLTGALKEAQAIASGTRCRQFLFSVSLNPPERENVPIATFEAAIERIEARTGLSGQPRVVIFHEKEGRRHAHAVWSRIDPDTMTARNLSHFKLKLRDISRDLYLEQGWQMPKGLVNSKEKDPRNFSLAEWQQAKRMGGHASHLKALMQACWAASDSKAAFEKALSERGFLLAKGDRRGHVAVSPEGEVLSIARYTGKKAKEIAAKLGPPEAFPSVEDAKARQAQAMRQTFDRHGAEAEHRKRRALEPLEAKRKAMAEQHAQERAKLDAAQTTRWETETKARAARLKSGIPGLWQALSGEASRIRLENERAAYAGLLRDRAQREALIFAQLEERRALQRRIVEARQRHAGLLRDLRQDRAQTTLLAPDAKAVLREPFARAKAERPARNRPQAPQTPSPQERLKALRSRRSSPGRSQGREPER